MPRKSYLKKELYTQKRGQKKKFAFETLKKLTLETRRNKNLMKNKRNFKNKKIL